MDGLFGLLGLILCLFEGINLLLEFLGLVFKGSNGLADLILFSLLLIDELVQLSDFLEVDSRLLDELHFFDQLFFLLTRG